LFKNGAQLEKIGKVRAIAFDKTGTLTTGQLQVFKVIHVSGYTEEDVLKVAASVESSSEHPIGEAIVQAARDLEWSRAIEVKAIPGQGIVGIKNPTPSPSSAVASTGGTPARRCSPQARRGTVAGVESSGQQQVIVGKADFVQQYVINLPDELKDSADLLEQQGKTVVWVAQGEEVLGVIAIADSIRAESARAIARLKKLGVEQIVMLTGDNERTAHSVAQAVGIDKVYAELLPEDKLHVIRRLQKEYQTVAMVGDGINDAPALAQASVGIAMGKVGSDVALETADIVLMADRLEKIEAAMRLGKRAQAIVKQNITIALGFIILLLIGNFLGSVNLPIGVIGHEGSTVIVTLSGLRLLK
jgi:Cd2+/Zn2+-exporting ATPase